MDCHWNPILATGNEIIDKQHQELFRKMDMLVMGIKNGQGKNSISDAIGFLEDYALRHFHLEEAMQISSNYPLYETHKLLHAEFSRLVMELKAEYFKQGPNCDLAIKILVNLGRWLSEHVDKKDRALAEYLKNLAQSPASKTS